MADSALVSGKKKPTTKTQETRVATFVGELASTRGGSQMAISVSGLEARSRGHVSLLESATDEALKSQVGSPHFVHVGDLARISFDLHAAFRKHIGMIAQRQGEVHVLFDQDDGQSLLSQAFQSEE